MHGRVSRSISVVVCCCTLLSALLVVCPGEVGLSLRAGFQPPPAVQQTPAEEMDGLLKEGQTALRKADFSTAERTFRAGLAKAEAAKDTERIATFLHHLGNLSFSLGEYGKALEYYQKALERREKRDNAQDIAQTLNSLGGVYASLGQPEQALETFQKALPLLEKLGNEQYIAFTLNNLGIVYRTLGQYDKALQFHQKALERSEKIGNPQYTPTFLNNLGTVYYFLGQSAKALEYYQKALERYEKIGNEQNIAQSFNNLGNIYADSLRQPEKALEYYQKALALFEKLGNPQYIASSLNNLGSVHASLGQPDRALEYYQKALGLNEKIGNPQHIVASLDNLGIVYRTLGQPEKALENLRRSLHIQQSYTTQVFAFSTELQMRQILASLPHSLDGLLTLATQPAPPSTSLPSALAWTLRRKAAALDAAARFRQREDALRRDPALRSDYERLLLLRAQSAALQRTEPERQKSAQEAEELEQKLKITFNMRYPAPQEKDTPADSTNSAALTEADAVLLARVRAQLPPGSALVEFVRFERRNFKARGREPDFHTCYLAFVLRQDTPEPALVDLGETDRLDAIKTGAVDQARQPLQRLARARRLPPSLLRASEAQFRKTAARLRQLAFDPLRAYLRGVTRLFLAPDGALTLFPFAALPEGEKDYLIQKYHISYLTSGRDLLGHERTIAPGMALAFLAPDYDQLPGQTAGQAALRRGKATDKEQQGIDRKPAGVRSEATGKKWSASTSRGAAKPGPGVPVAQQAPDGINPGQYSINRMLGGAASAATFPSLSALLGKDRLTTHAARLQKQIGAAVITDRQATEERFVAVKSPRVLYALTHGFFVAAQTKHTPGRDKPARIRKPPPSRGSKGSSLAGRLTQERLTGITDPMLRSGIVLAGANRWREVQKHGIADGWVTAAEMALMDLRGTELVVMAACETGLGDALAGEGVFGVRRALLLAGAKSVMGSLFEVPPEQTVALTEQFYAGLRSGLERGEALRSAQLSLLHKPETRHPFFWASFVLTGHTETLKMR